MSTLPFAICRPDSSSRARLGRLETPHGVMDTPAFIPVGTQAAVASLQPQEVAALGGQALLVNTYHLLLRPGPDSIAGLGGLHAFMRWPGPLFTDSGSYQVFSLGLDSTHGIETMAGALPDRDRRAHRRSGGEAGAQAATRSASRSAAQVAQARVTKVDDGGVTFRSHIDGSTHRLTPESSIAIQEAFGADVMLAFDELSLPRQDGAQAARALRRTHRWAERCLEARRSDRALYGVVQGGAFRALRAESAAFVSGLPFDGFAIGGSLGTTRRDLRNVLAWTVPALPDERPRHLPGIGEPDLLFECVAAGIDTFASVGPTRLARRGILYTPDGALAVDQARYREDDGPIYPGCACPTCRTFSRAYLRHLFAAEELLAATLAATHNLAFILNLTAKIRDALARGTFPELRASFLSRYRPAGRRRPAPSALPQSGEAVEQVVP
ncbi:MAG: tRNA guanosine(34) transglycosylase Tgt [Chloroflexi bacterium]|nr:tRNA guanosine(34) transglycosylase Tgt [Chloroflexota bacterium]